MSTEERDTVSGGLWVLSSRAQDLRERREEFLRAEEDLHRAVAHWGHRLDREQVAAAAGMSSVDVHRIVVAAGPYAGAPQLPELPPLPVPRP